MAYGAKGKFKYKQIEGKITCNNANFGDPIYGVVKDCFCLSSSTPRPRRLDGGRGRFLEKRSKKTKKDAAIRKKNATRKKFLLMMHRAKARAIAKAKAAAAKARAYFRMSRSRALRKKKASWHG